jgi:glutamate synthase domain-containing protein 3
MVDPRSGPWPTSGAAGPVERHLELTASASPHGLDNWQSRLPYFVKVMPIEYRTSLERMRQEAEMQAETVSATEEVFD